MLASVEKNRSKVKKVDVQTLLPDDGQNGLKYVRGLTIKFANSILCSSRGRSGQKPQYDLMTLA
jgi:hypothetical protein